MLKKSHRAFALALSPLLFIPIPTVKYLDIYILKYNQFFAQIYTNFSIEHLFLITIFFIGYFIGSTLPDIDHYFKYLYAKEDRDKRYLYHRQTTHSILLIILMLFVSLHYVLNPILFAISLGLCLGVITHQIGDMLTGSIPILFYAPYYLKFARIGITRIVPKSLYSVFSDKLPKYLNKNYKVVFGILFVVNILIVLILKFQDKLHLL